MSVNGTWLYFIEWYWKSQKIKISLDESPLYKLVVGKK